MSSYTPEFPLADGVIAKVGTYSENPRTARLRVYNAKTILFEIIVDHETAKSLKAGDANSKSIIESLIAASDPTTVP